MCRKRGRSNGRFYKKLFKLLIIDRGMKKKKKTCKRRLDSVPQPLQSSQRMNMCGSMLLVSVLCIDVDNGDIMEVTKEE